MFGLFHRFSGTELPAHDPEALIALTSLSDAAQTPGETVETDEHPQEFSRSLAGLHKSGASLFHPFPNESSYRLGQWHYSDNASNSKQRFRDLTEIVGAPTFKPEDIHSTNWQKMHEILGRNEFDAGDPQSGDQFEGMDKDAGWRSKPIIISVPFHRRSFKRGVLPFTAGDLYYRSLVDVIREKLHNPLDDAQFHYEPYELRWQPGPDKETNTRVHGEFYTSPTFLAAHQRLQEAPNEPGCTLPKVVLAMEFFSDATQLTHFGNAKLWPLYLYFLNESKYRRCKPTANLCNHVAYFQSVRDTHRSNYTRLTFRN